MRNDELCQLLKQYPDNFKVMVNFEHIEKVEVIEGTTSDGPGTINIEGDGA